MVKYVVISTVLFFCVVQIRGSITNDIPEYVKIKKCHRLDPNLNQCLLKASVDIKPYLLKGIPELRLQPVEPLKISQISLIGQDTGVLKYKGVLKNVTVRGLSNYKFTKFDFDVEKLHWTLNGTIEPVDVDGNFDGSGEVLGIRAGGNGTFSMHAGKCAVIVDNKAKVAKKNSKDYLETENVNVKITSSDLNVHFNGLFGDDKQIDDLINKIINENIDVLFAEFKPTLEETVNSLVDSAILKPFTDHISYDSLYPPTP